jgi:hypothetical protein
LVFAGDLAVAFRFAAAVFVFDPPAFLADLVFLGVVVALFRSSASSRSK